MLKGLRLFWESDQRGLKGTKGDQITLSALFSPFRPFGIRRSNQYPREAYLAFEVKTKKSPTERSSFLVGIPGFEPGTLCSQSRCANRTALHPVAFELRCKGTAIFLFCKFFYNFFAKTFNFFSFCGTISDFRCSES